MSEPSPAAASCQQSNQSELAQKALQDLVHKIGSLTEQTQRNAADASSISICNVAQRVFEGLHAIFTSMPSQESPCALNVLAATSTGVRPSKRPLCDTHLEHMTDALLVRPALHCLVAFTMMTSLISFALSGVVILAQGKHEPGHLVVLNFLIGMRYSHFDC